jgi:hypothetical protein
MPPARQDCFKPLPEPFPGHSSRFQVVARQLALTERGSSPISRKRGCYLKGSHGSGPSNRQQPYRRSGDCPQQLSPLDASDRKFSLTHGAQQALLEVGSESRIYD